jgi:polyhydroxyalkanoate synthesis regulator phasin
MPQTPDLSRYLDAGAQFVAMTRSEARRRAKELVAAGQLAQGQVQSFVDDLVDESRRRTDEMTNVVRKEIQRQMTALGIATKDDLARLESKLTKRVDKQAKQSARAVAARTPDRAAKAGKKAAGKKAAGKKSTSRKAAGSPGKQAPAQQLAPQSAANAS